jgi:hypothetical protein
VPIHHQKGHLQHQPVVADAEYDQAHARRFGLLRRNDGSSCKGSPGSCYCTQLGGTDLFGGINAAGGGWVNNADPNDVLDACIFPDLSSIDSYGLFYHSANIIRGKNLAKVLRYKNPN